jgi:hypothetical protein
VPIVIAGRIDSIEGKGNEVWVFYDIVPNPTISHPGVESLFVSLDLSEHPTVLPNNTTPHQGSPSSLPQSTPPPVPPVATDTMPSGLWLFYGTDIILQPGKILEFSLPSNAVSPKWHTEIKFQFDLKGNSPIRSAYNVIAFYKEDINLAGGAGLTNPK